EKLIILIYILGGQLVQEPKVLSVRHSNIVKGGHYNIFIEDSIVVFITRYYKGYIVSSNIKIIY
ncbi:uncharacterized protein BDZ99DRAFT_381559, partial [Mytilinidion resinicola]